MQRHMREYQLNSEQTDSLLARGPVGVLSTLNRGGTPYGIPVHFVFEGGAVYIHCLPVGQKTDNLANNENICFTVYDLQGYIFDPENRACNTNTAYESVVITGRAAMVSDIAVKEKILDLFVAKYTPGLAGSKLPASAVKSTGLIKITVSECTGKYYNK